jgi:hypothetical protein
VIALRHPSLFWDGAVALPFAVKLMFYRLAQALGYLYTPYVPWFGDYDWLESTLIISSSYPCGINSLSKSNRIEANQRQNAKVDLRIEVTSKLRRFVIEASLL